MFDAENDWPSKAKALNNCANLLRNDPALLSEARELAEQALAIKETFDPVQRKYGRRIRILAAIADAQGDAGAAHDWRAGAPVLRRRADLPRNAAPASRRSQTFRSSTCITSKMKPLGERKKASRRLPKAAATSAGSIRTSAPSARMRAYSASRSSTS